MKLQRMFFGFLALGAVAMLAADARADRYDTADPGGADTELRESQATTARGTGTEIASRIASTADGASGRNSVIFLKFGIGSMTPAELADDITVRTTYRNTNLTPGRIEDVAGGGPNTGFDYYVLDPTHPNADWDEATLDPLTASTQGLGYVLDLDFRTKGTGTPGAPSPGLTYLDSNLYDSADLVGASAHLPVGGAFDLVASAGSPLHSAIATAQGTVHQTVIVAMAIAHEWDNPNSNWLGFNYLFNPKEQDPLNNDADSPFGGASNANGGFAPALLTIPEPSSLVLLGLGGLALVRRRR